jgi:hypothetical protein
MSTADRSWSIHRPSGRSVWTAKELTQKTDWVFHYPDETLKEIDACLARVKAQGTAIEDIAASDFPLKTLGNWLGSIKEEIARGRGFIVMRGLPASRYSLDDLKRTYWGIGANFGVAEAQSYLGDRIGDVIDLSDEEPDYFRRRGYKSGGAQNAHTDSSDIVSMLSITLAKSGGASRLASAHTVHNLMLDHCPDLLKILYDGFYMRGTDTDAAGAGRAAMSKHRVPIYMYTDGWLNSFFVNGYIRRPVMAGDVALSPVEEAAIQAFNAFANHPDVMTNMLLEPGDMQFLNNRTVFHGRAQYEDHPEKERRRHLLRLWLRVPEWPRMSPDQEVHPTEVRRLWAENAQKREAAHA